MHVSTAFIPVLLGAAVSAYELPGNLKSIYDKHRARDQTGNCQSSLSAKFDGGAAYCGDIPGAIFLKSNGAYDNMDIDCDGANNAAGDCANDPSGQGQTSFVDTVKKFGIKDLDANLHSYVVFGTNSFDPQKHGLKPLSVMAVVCNNQVFYGVWGDTNGFRSTGEASISLAQLCFPNEGLNGNKGHGKKDVLYIGFTGDEAVPGAKGANWKAKTPKQFQDSIKGLGDRLVAGLKA
ncbi:hypothetical protein NM208_g15399 [Fusarium decemcellulare]|uniref:Uncharacterized protein n=1 Tax=Fusarium decemcellulare TaxID=57161 RepID=A0ACC1RD50_9HYPO|nr:hypothetical protein NM208_g15399 [Fusarium decemcellulare]